MHAESRQLSAEACRRSSLVLQLHKPSVMAITLERKTLQICLHTAMNMSRNMACQQCLCILCQYSLYLSYWTVGMNRRDGRASVGISVPMSEIALGWTSLANRSVDACSCGLAGPGFEEKVSHGVYKEHGTCPIAACMHGTNPWTTWSTRVFEIAQT